MRPVFENGTPVPAFLNKLWKMVDDEKTNDLISWSPNGQSFIIKHQGDFCAKLLPQFYKHNNMASFVRQLNMYGFHKVSNVENGVQRGEREEIEFFHIYFKRGEPKMVEKIKRKMSSRITNVNNAAEENAKNLEMMSKVLKDVAQMRGKQMSLDAQLATMKQHNVALWRELSLLRRKHHKQQQIVNKLIQFLLSLVHPSRNNMNGLGVKRRYPLMINDISTKNSKISRHDSSNSNNLLDTSGPTIHEIDATDALLEEAEMLEDYIEPLIEIYSPDSQHNNSNSKRHIDPTTSISLSNASVSSSSDITSLKAPIVLEFDESSLANDDCSDLLLATSSNLVTPKQKQIKTRNSNTSLVQIDKSPKTIVMKPNKKNQLVKIAKIEASQDNDIQTQQTIDDSDTSLLNIDPSDNSILQTAHDYGFVLTNDGEVDEADSTALITPNDLTLTRLLQTVKTENDSSPSAIEIEQIDTTTNNDNDDLTPSNTESIDIDYFLPTSPVDKSDSSLTDNSIKAELNNHKSSNNQPNTVDDDESAMMLATLAQSAANSAAQRSVNSVSGLPCSEEFDTQLETVQTELETLKDLLMAERYSIDANTLLGLFGADDPLSYTLPSTTESNTTSSTTTTTTEPISKSTITTTSTDPLLTSSELICTPASFDLNMFSPNATDTFVTPDDNSVDPNEEDIMNLNYFSDIS